MEVKVIISRELQKEIDRILKKYNYKEIFFVTEDKNYLEYLMKILPPYSL